MLSIGNAALWAFSILALHLAFVHPFTDRGNLCLLFRVFREVSTYISLCSPASLSGRNVGLDLIAIDAFSGAKLSQVEGHSLLDGAEIVEAVENLDLIVSALHVAKDVISSDEMLRHVLKRQVTERRTTCS